VREQGVSAKHDPGSRLRNSCQQKKYETFIEKVKSRGAVELGSISWGEWQRGKERTSVSTKMVKSGLAGLAGW